LSRSWFPEPSTVRHGDPHRALTSVSGNFVRDCASVIWLSNHAVAEMRRKRSVADAELLEPDALGEHIEQPHSPTEKVRRKMDEDFIDEVGPQCLLPGGCAAKLDVLVARRGFRLPYRALDPVCDEGEI
jgi:hypothetical protein